MRETRDRFADLVAPGDGRLDGELDVGALLIAQAVDPHVSIERQLVRLDDLARGVDATSAHHLAESLFGGDRFDPAIHFSGNRNQYYDVANSLLHRVLDRRVGIPITLSVLMLEIGRRRGLDLEGVGMPGHFLVRGPGGYVDAFHRGRLLDEHGCLEVFRTLAGPDADLPPGALEATPPAAILRRMLANLAAIGPARQGRRSIAAVYGLLASFPEAAGQDHVRHAVAAAEIGQFGEAASAGERALGLVPSAMVAELEGRIVGWRARLN